MGLRDTLKFWSEPVGSDDFGLTREEWDASKAAKKAAAEQQAADAKKGS